MLFANIMAIRLFRHAAFNVDALCQLARSLRHGRSCSCDATQAPADGSLYWAVFVVFDDGVEWVFRSPRRDGAIRSMETIRELLASEVATLKYISSHSTIPVPEVYAYSDSKDNTIGVPYILMSKASGFPLSKKWKSLESRTSTLSLKAKAKVLSQLGFITWQLSQLRFEEIGSLFEENGLLQVKNCLSQGLVVSQRDTLEELPRGPFSSEREYFEALVSGLLQHAECLQLTHHCFFAPCPTRNKYDNDHEYHRACDLWNNFVTFGSKIDSSENRVDYTVIGDSLREIASEWAEKMSSPFDSKRFPLHHPDLNVNNIFVDDDFRITCIIDWTFCSSVPLSILFMAPGLPQSRNELEAPLAAAFEGGLNRGISTDHEGNTIRKFLHKLQMFPGNRFVWLLYRLVTFDSTGDFYLFHDIWRMSDQSYLDFSTFFRSKQSSDRYLQLHKEMKQDDEPLDQVMRQETEYFQRDIIGLTIAKKLTLASEWTSRYRNPGSNSVRCNGDVFVADDKLWKWVLMSLEQTDLG
ncbi:RNase H domain-containing protein [Histoplasma ohiense]|nr:RNase H domain-containing protein [Histoplasma ohiense (nom. inval.)]